MVHTDSVVLEEDNAAVTTSRPEQETIHMRKLQSFENQGNIANTTEHQDIEAQPRTSQSNATLRQEPSHTGLSDKVSRLQDGTNQGTFSNITSTTVPPDLEAALPPMKYSRAFRTLRWAWLTIYHRLCLLVLVPNVIVMVTLAAEHNLFKIPMPDLATAVAANTAAAILMRQELVINLLFILVNNCPRSAPLGIRRHLAKIYHFGGVHSGAGIAATIWFTLFNAELLWGWRTHAIPGLWEHRFPFIVAITLVVDLLLILIVVFAHPKLRRAHHNTFEAVHRFAGWMAVLLFWIHLVMFTHLLEQSKEPRRPLGVALLHSPTLYLLILITVSLIIPWLRLRRVPVQVELLSNHATRLHFRYTNVELCTAARITDNPLKEWHSFASIPEPDGNGFSIIVSNAGDWTKKMIQHPPKKLWVRGIPTRGVLHTAPMFNKLVLVATGSGIGPVLSLLSARDVPCRVLWSARRPISTYKKDIMDEVFTADPAALVFDTKAMDYDQRPDLLKLAYNLYRESDAEAVFVISNQAATEELIYGLESRGVPAFAPIFDS
jgi:hypothetical protein